MTDLVIFGAGGHGREVLQVALDMSADRSRWNLIGFADEDETLAGQSLQGLPVLGGLAQLRDLRTAALVVAIGAPARRRRVVERLRDAGWTRFARLVHPLAWCGRNVEIAEGSVVCAGVKMTTDIQIGRHVLLNLNCTIGHDVRIGDFATLAPGVGVSGGCQVGEGAELGTHSTLIPKVVVGNWSVLGAGAVAIQSIEPDATAVGIPARTIRRRELGWHLA